MLSYSEAPLYSQSNIFLAQKADKVKRVCVYVRVVWRRETMNLLADLLRYYSNRLDQGS